MPTPGTEKAGEIHTMPSHKGTAIPSQAGVPNKTQAHAKPLTLQALSSFLLSLAVRSQEARTENLLSDALLELQPLIPFDSAWWGELSQAGPGMPARNWLHGSIGLSPSFAQEWNLLAVDDKFAERSITQPGIVITESLDTMVRPVAPHLDAFIRNHGLHHVMGVTLAFPFSGLHFFIALYRGASRHAFAPQETAVFDGFARHLVHHWTSRLHALQNTGAPAPWDAYALANANGTLLYLGRRFAAALDEAYPGWSGTTLPFDMSDALPTVAGSVVLRGSNRLKFERHGSLIALALHQGGGSKPMLAPRELSAATLYAQGQSSKEIAALWGRTPSTVRTYLRNAYAQLGVSNKVELAKALQAMNLLAR